MPGTQKKAAVPGTAAFKVLLQSQSGFGAWCAELKNYLTRERGRTCASLVCAFMCIKGFTDPSFLPFFTGFAFAMFRLSLFCLKIFVVPC
jgi:hypothetical protein